MGILGAILFGIVYLPLGVIFGLVGEYSGKSRRCRCRGRRRW